MDLTTSEMQGAAAQTNMNDFDFANVWRTVTGDYPALQLSRPNTIFLDANASGVNNGTTWTNAYTSLQDALAAATGNDEIWITEGTYTPGSNRGDSFTITGNQNGLGLYGGFAGGETQRDPDANVVKLSGNSASSGGGAIHNSGVSGESSPVITNATFSGNSSRSGGAIFNDGGSGFFGGTSSPTITNAILFGNGDEMSSISATPQLSNTLIAGGCPSGATCSDPVTGNFVNASDPAGPDGILATADDGLRLFEGSPAAIDAGDNAAVSAAEDVTGAPRVQDGTVDLGAYEGGVANPAETIYVDASAAGANDGTSWTDAFTDLQNALAQAGGAAGLNDRGGGLFCDGGGGGNGCSPTLTGVTFTGNRASLRGGAINNDGNNNGASSPQITGSTFSDNVAGLNGGAIYNDGNRGESSPKITGSTFSGNSAAQQGGAIYNNGSGNGNEIYNFAATPTLSHTLVEGGIAGISENNGSSTTNGGDNLNVNPLFADAGDPAGPDGQFATADDGFNLQPSSPAIGVGNSSAANITNTDITGDARIIGTEVDMGAYEGPLTLTVSGGEGWRMMTAPANGADYGTLPSTLFTQGFTGADFTNGVSNVQVYTEGDNATDASGRGFGGISDASTVPAAGQGFITYVFADDDPNTAGVQGGFPKNLPILQPNNTGSVSPSLTYTDTGAPSTDGFNMVGNPYGATIDWDSPGFTKTNLSQVIYVWDSNAGGGAGVYRTYNGTAGDLTNGLVAPWQGFWVQANADNPALQFTEQVQSNGGIFYGTPGGQEQQDRAPLIRFELSEQRSDPSTALQSSAYLMFTGQASVGPDALDAWKLASLNPSRNLALFTTVQDRALDINALPKEVLSNEGAALEIPMDLKGSDIGGAYRLSWNPKDLPNTLTEGSITLIDLHTDAEIDVQQAGEYTFSVEKAAVVSKKVCLREDSLPVV